MATKSNNSADKTYVVSRETMKRLAHDIKDIIRSDNELAEQGIYYKYDEEDMMKGYAMILGPKDTPYYGGYFLFEFIFPNNYPYSPPKLVYHTNNGNTRFNPNLYKSGKVCLSILNTWEGEPWTACQTISTILVTLCTVLNETPLINEPGYKLTHPDVNKYSDIVRYNTLDFAMLKLLKAGFVHNLTANGDRMWGSFVPVMREIFLERYNEYREMILELSKSYKNGQSIRINYQNQSAVTDYISMVSVIDEVYAELQ
jgi:ubiquitin-protein ligase